MTVSDRILVACVLIAAAGWYFVRLSAKARAGGELSRLNHYRESAR